VAPRYRLGIDIGGTFTDGVLADSVTGEMHSIKVPTTPKDLTTGFMAIVDRARTQHGLDCTKLAPIVHATTQATNAILEGKLAATGLVVTRGFRDLFEVQRMIRPALYDLNSVRPKPLVPRRLCLEVTERMDAQGNVIVPLHEEELRGHAAFFRREKLKALVVCLLHSYTNPAHELRAVEILREELPGVFVVASCSVSAESGEYVRASTSVLNAALMPLVSDYFKQLKVHLADRGAPDNVLVMQSNGGILPADVVTERPIFIVESGPAAGVISVASLVTTLGIDGALAFDMGGTTAKAGLIRTRLPRMSPEYEVGTQAVTRVELNRGAGYPVKTPVIDLVEIGAGGGSIGWVDAGGVLRVGPISAGADPGPACYATGGDRPTITDANLVLGRIDPTYFLGGEIKLSTQRAAEALSRHCATPLDISVEAAALAMIEIANASMLTALRIVSVQRGHNPKDLVLVCTGGAAGLHANALGKALGAKAVIVPTAPGVASARGLLAADLRREFRASKQVAMSRAAADVLNTAFATLEAHVPNAFGATAESTDIDLRYSVEARFVGQSYALQIDAPAPPLRAESVMELDEAFRAAHRERYGYAPADEKVEIVTVCLTARKLIPKSVPRTLGPGGSGNGNGSQAHLTGRPVWFGAAGSQECRVYDRYRLGSADVVLGPAVIEERDSTILVNPESRAAVDGYGNLYIEWT
jgi:N-methylhydantoinase A